MTYELINYYDSPNTIVSIKHTDSNGIVTMIPLDDGNRHYQQYIQDIKNGMSNVTCTDCGDGIPNDSMWQCLDNAEELLVNKYGSDQDKLTALREDRYVRAMTAKTPYESKVEAYKIIDATSQEIKDKNRHLPMRR
tara:strand:- start:238 stop:645 length:408 start_codon:yes stop_codon:yes gene_type:complete